MRSYEVMCPLYDKRSYSELLATLRDGGDRELQFGINVVVTFNFI